MNPLTTLHRHRQFMVVSAVLLALLYAEEAWGLSSLWPHRPPSEWILWIAGIALFVAVGTLVAFFLPLRLADVSKHPRSWGVMITAMIQSAAVTIALNVVVFFLYLLLVDFDLAAASMILKDVYFFTLFTIGLFHSLLLYVRYMHYLYAQFGGADSAAKPIAATGSSAAIILIVGLWLFGFDITWANTAPEAIRAIVNLHVYARDLYLWTLTFMAFSWHLRWVADH